MLRPRISCDTYSVSMHPKKLITSTLVSPWISALQLKQQETEFEMNWGYTVEAENFLLEHQLIAGDVQIVRHILVRFDLKYDQFVGLFPGDLWHFVFVFRSRNVWFGNRL